MDCGTPFCNNGCPVNNIIPDFNDLVYQGDWKNAITAAQHQQLPRVHGPHLPAPCEAACVANINGDAIGIKSIEHSIIDRAWSEGWVKPCCPSTRPARRWPWSVPALQAWRRQQLVRAGHDVTVFEKNDRVGGLLRYGIPDFKLDKGLIDRRVEQMVAEGLKIRTGVLIAGKDGLGKDSRSPTGPRKPSARAAQCRVRRRAADRRLRAVA
jgi:glutamate synthase (NADPH/NADH) small chain